MISLVMYGNIPVPHFILWKALKSIKRMKIIQLQVSMENIIYWRGVHMLQWAIHQQNAPETLIVGISIHLQGLDMSNRKYSHKYPKYC